MSSFNTKDETKVQRTVIDHKSEVFEYYRGGFGRTLDLFFDKTNIRLFATPPQHLYDKNGNEIIDYRIKLLEFAHFLNQRRQANIPIELYIYKLGQNPENLNVPCSNAQATPEELPSDGLLIDLHYKHQNGFSLFAYEKRGEKQVRFRVGLFAATPIEPEIYTDNFRE